MIVLFLAFSIPPDWVYLNAKTAQDRHTQRGIEMDRIDEAVVIAMDARRRSYGRTTLGSKEAQDFEAMRAALLASLPVLLGEPVAWQYRDVSWGDNWASITNAQYDSYMQEASDPGWQVRALYAPSLGEGDGR